MISLHTINQRAHTHAFSIDDIPWSTGVDPTRLAFPTDHMPLAFTAGWSLLDDAERLTANQWYACAVSEQFIFLEEAFLMTAVRALLRHERKRLDPALREALEVFLVEEEKHGAMFRRLLIAAAPEWYEKSDRHFYTPGALGVHVAALCLQFPTLFVAWPWLGLILEEKTIALHRAYERAAAAGAPLDPLHASVHRHHFLDEARHVQLEAHLVQRLWDGAAAPQRALNGKLLFNALGQYTRPRAQSVSANIVRALAQKYPRLHRHVDTLLHGLTDLANDPRFQRAIYGKDAIPQAFHQLEARPELHGVTRVAPDFALHLASAAGRA